MTVKCTSKASHLTIRENGTEDSQLERIYEIIALGGKITMKQILEIYIYKWGDIDYSSISARCNYLKGNEEKGIPQRIFEVGTGKCPVSGRTVNLLSATKEKGLGQWQAWVEMGKDKKEQLARFAVVPESMKKQVQSHMKTVIALKLVK